jgi:hypothetical protein
LRAREENVEKATRVVNALLPWVASLGTVYANGVDVGQEDAIDFVAQLGGETEEG